MRYLIALLLAASPVSAWEFSPSPICTLTDADAVTLTYDGAVYSIHLTRASGWPDAPVFGIRFAPFGPVISTTRHVISGTTLTVTDRGFGNVLTGLEQNATATAFLGDVTMPIDLDGAADPVAEFRACKPGAPSV